MQKIISLAFYLLFFQVVSAQIQISKEHMPKAGETHEYISAQDIGGFDYEVSGESIHWDFSQLGSNRKGEYKYLSADKTPYKINFGFDAVGSKLADTLGSSFGSINNVYEYYRTTNDNYSRVGFAFNIPDISMGLKGKHERADAVFLFPLKYGMEYSNKFDLKIPIGSPPFTMGNYFQSGSRTSKVVGWGWISLPNYDSIPCLKVESVVVQNDSTSVPIQNINFNINNSRKEFVWLTQSSKIPALEINEQEIQNRTLVTKIRYSAISKNTGFSKYLQRNNSINIYPNPNNGYFVLQSELPIRSVNVYNLQGSIVHKSEGQNTLALTSLVKGTYIIHIQTSQGVFVERVLIQ